MNYAQGAYQTLSEGDIFVTIRKKVAARPSLDALRILEYLAAPGSSRGVREADEVSLECYLDDYLHCEPHDPKRHARWEERRIIAQERVRSSLAELMLLEVVEAVDRSYAAAMTGEVIARMAYRRTA